MQVALTISDFLDRAALVYAERVGVVDEPGAPACLGRLSHAELGARARGMAAALDSLKVGAGGRVGIVSPNSARFLVSLFGVSGSGRVLVPINFRLNASEVGYIVEHSETEVLLVDPELDEALSGINVRERIVLDGGPADRELFAPLAPGREPKGWEPDESATCSINYTSGTTARPKGVELTHRNCALNAMSFGWHATVTDRDVLLHSLPMFHCNGWGMPYAATGMGARHVVLRRVDGEEILRRVESEGVTLMCGAPTVVASVLAASESRSSRHEPVPGAGTVRVIVAGAPPPSKIIERVESELGWEFIQIYGLTETAPLLTINRARSEWDELGPPERARRLCRAGPPAIGVKLAIDDDGEVVARSNHVFAGYWRQPQESAEVLEGGWFRTGDGGYLDGADLVFTVMKPWPRLQS